MLSCYKSVQVSSLKRRVNIKVGNDVLTNKKTACITLPENSKAAVRSLNEADSVDETIPNAGLQENSIVAIVHDEDYQIHGENLQKSDTNVDDTKNRDSFEDQQRTGLIPMETNADSSDEKSDPFATESDETYSAESEASTESEGNLLERKSKKCRKRIRNEKNWSANKRKAARAKGVEYKTKKNKTVRARSLKPPCSCRKKCYEKLTYEERLGLFNDFYTLSYQEQTQLLSTLVNEFTKLRCINNDEGSRRKFSRSYFLKKENVLIKVCKIMFLNTLDIGFKRIRYTMEKCRGGSGICTPDNRGRHGNHKRVSDEDRKIVMDHISKFPAYKSHYSRSHSNKRYLSPDLSIQQMYRLYTDHCKEIGRTPVSDHFYRNIFVTEFNISFHPPHNDTCGKCDKLEVLIKACSDEGDRIHFEREKKAHLEAANDAYEEKRKTKIIARKVS
nr:unnamed protein product [Callosobruchus analis]